MKALIVDSCETMMQRCGVPFVALVGLLPFVLAACTDATSSTDPRTQPPLAEGLQPPDVSNAVWKELQPVIAQLPAGYRIEQRGSIEESGKANRALAPLFPIMIALTLIIIIFQVRSISVMTMVLATAPLGLIGVIPTLLLFQQPFGINALVGLIALSGILMRNTLILIGQIRQNEKDGLAPFDAVVEATVQRSRPVILTALA